MLFFTGSLTNMKIEINTQEVIKKAEKEVSTIVDYSKVVVNSQPTLAKAHQQLGILKGVKKNIKEQKDGIVKPINEALKNIRELFAPVEKKINVIEDYLKGQVLDYNQKLAEEEKKKEKEAAEKLAKGEDIGKATKSLEKTQEKKAAIKNVRKIKKLKITDVNKIPREFMIPDEVKIRQALLAGAKVEGAELYEEEILAY